MLTQMTRARRWRWGCHVRSRRWRLPRQLHHRAAPSRSCRSRRWRLHRQLHHRASPILSTTRIAVSHRARHCRRSSLQTFCRTASAPSSVAAPATDPHLFTLGWHSTPGSAGAARGSATTNTTGALSSLLVRLHRSRFGLRSVSLKLSAATPIWSTELPAGAACPPATRPLASMSPSGATPADAPWRPRSGEGSAGGARTFFVLADARLACGDPFGWLGRPAQELAPFPILLRTGPKRGGASSLAFRKAMAASADGARARSESRKRIAGGVVQCHSAWL